MDIVVNGAVNQNWQIVDQWSNVNAGGGCRLNWAISDVPIQSNQGHIFIIIQFQFVGALCKQIQIELIGGSFWVAQQGIHGGTLWGDHWWDLWGAHLGSHQWAILGPGTMHLNFSEKVTICEGSEALCKFIQAEKPVLQKEPHIAIHVALHNGADLRSSAGRHFLYPLYQILEFWQILSE